MTSLVVPRLDIRQHEEQIRSLQQFYAVEGSESELMEILAEQTSIYSTLLDAVAPLEEAFGKPRVLTLHVLSTGDEAMLKAAVQLPEAFDDPDGALRRFDLAWWLSNCQRSGGMLAFDYEIQDGL